MTRSPFLALFVIPISIAGALFACVGDEPLSADDAGAGANDAQATDGNPTGDGSTGDAGGDASTDPCGGSIDCPSRQNPTHLQVWLRGDLGVDCNAGRVTTWHDQSGHHHDATGAAYPDGGPALAPQCGASTINGRGVVSFTAPNTGIPYVDEIFNLELGFMAGGPWTVIVVHRPLAPPRSEDYRGLLAAARPFHTFVSCISEPPPENDGTLDIVFHSSDAGGSLFYNAYPQCAPIESAAYARGTVTFDTAVYDSAGHILYGDGTQIYSDGEGVDLTGVSAEAGSLSPGVLGRDSNDGTIRPGDSRYAGDIAEVIVYDAALSTELTALNAYVKKTWNVP